MPPALIQGKILTNSPLRLCLQPHPSPLLPPEGFALIILSASLIRSLRHKSKGRERR
jgi:hypothetical protein